MLEKKKRSKKVWFMLLMLVMVTVNSVVALAATTLSGKKNNIYYEFTGSAVQRGTQIRATGSTYAGITLNDKKDYVYVKIAKEYTNKKGVKAVATVAEYKTNKVRNTSLVEDVPKTMNGKSVVARVGHSFSHGTATYMAYTIY